MKNFRNLIVALLLISAATTFAQQISQEEENLFYATLEDYQNYKPIAGISIVPRLHVENQFDISYGGAIKRVKCSSKDWPSDFFTHNGFLLRMFGKEPYIVLAMGKINYYSKWSEQNKIFTQDDWNGKLRKYNINHFAQLLKQYDLYEDYRNDKPKREFRDDVNGYFNKFLSWQVAYFKLLNKKMEE